MVGTKGWILVGTREKWYLDPLMSGILKFTRPYFLANFYHICLLLNLYFSKGLASYLQQRDERGEDGPDADEVDGDVDGVVVVRRVEDELLLKVERVPQAAHGGGGGGEVEMGIRERRWVLERNNALDIIYCPAQIGKSIS